MNIVPDFIISNINMFMFLFTYTHIILEIILCLYYTGQGSGFSVSGRIESGYLQQGDNVLVLPANEHASVKGMTYNMLSSYVTKLIYI